VHSILTELFGNAVSAAGEIKELSLEITKHHGMMVCGGVEI